MSSQLLNAPPVVNQQVLRNSARVAAGNRWVPWGDSLTGAPSAVGRQAADVSDGGYLILDDRAWPTYAHIIEPRLRMINNSGKGGDTTDDAMLRFPTDIRAYNPHIVTIMIGRNDNDSSAYIFDSTTYLRATSLTYIKAMVAAVRSIGAIPVLCTLPPTDRPTLPADTPKRDARLRAWLIEYARDQGIQLLDFAAVLTDPTTGKWISGYGNDPGGVDGVHPTPAGAKAMADYAVAQLRPLLPAWTPRLPIDEQGWDGNLVTTPLISGTTGSGRPSGSGWTESQSAGISGGVTWDTDATDTTIAGSWLRVTADNVTFSSGSTGSSIKAFTVASTGGLIVAGHKLRLVGRVAQSGFSGAFKWSASLRFSTAGASTSDWGYLQLTQPCAAGIINMDFTVPSAANQVQLQIRCDVVPGCSGVAKWAQLGLYDLTALGLSPLN